MRGMLEWLRNIIGMIILLPIIICLTIYHTLCWVFAKDDDPRREG